MKNTVKIATRGSLLSLSQAAIVRRKIESYGYETELTLVATDGDKNQSDPLRRIGGNGLFVREIERVLSGGDADIAVHSAKDLPFTLADGMMIGGVPDMADPRDILLINASNFDDEPEYETRGAIFGLPKAAVIGTGSPRRIRELSEILPDVTFRNIRGNINTRIEKLRTGSSGHYDAVVLAKAGFDRLQLPIDDLSKKIFEPFEVIPAPCQGILAVECRKDDQKMRDLLSKITDENAYKRFTVERTVFTSLQADCAMPVGVYADIRPDERMLLSVRYNEERVALEGTYENYEALCEAVVKRVSGQGV